MSLDVGTYELRTSPEVIAVQWTDESQAVDLVQWIEERWDQPGGGPVYDSTFCGASGPRGEDWGELVIDYLTDPMQTTQVAPFDWIVYGIAGHFFVVPPERFGRVYARKAEV